MVRACPYRPDLFHSDLFHIGQGPLQPGNRFPVEGGRRKRGSYSCWIVFNRDGGRGNSQLSHWKQPEEETLHGIRPWTAAVTEDYQAWRMRHDEAGHKLVEF